MSILWTISRGKRPRHIFALIYGTDGVGKSTLCSHAPNPIFIGAEKGTEQLDVARFPQTESIGELLTQVRALQNEKHEFDSVVLDSLDWVEPLIWKAVCDEGKVETIEQYAGGYGKGYARALDLWRTLIRELSILNEHMHVLLIGHAQIKSFQDPELSTSYDRYQLKINDKAAALVREAADAVLFAQFETELVKTNGKTESKNDSQANAPQETKRFEPQNGSESPLLAKVRTRLEESKISESEFLDILRCAQIAEAESASSLAEIPDETLQLAIQSWDTVVELASEFRRCKETAA